MSAHTRPTEAASELTDPSEGPGTGVSAVEALARILDPRAFERLREKPDVATEQIRSFRRAHAVLCATRAVAAGYRLVSEERLAQALHDGPLGEHAAGACIDIAVAALAVLRSDQGGPS